MPSFSTKSKERLLTCHPDLQRLFNEVIKHIDVAILCGHRSEEDQEEAYKSGHSKLRFPHSKHNCLPSLAVDVAPCPINWEDLDSFRHAAVIIKEIAARLGIKVEWAGDWTHFREYPHWQLPE